MLTAAVAANDDVASRQMANDKTSSLRGSAAPVIAANGGPSLPAKPATSLSGGKMAAFSAIFPPLMVDRRKSTRGYGRREPRILEAMEMIRREACDGLTVAALAARFPGSRRLFDMRFREAAGHSALDEILNVRLARAMELLIHTDIPIASVAHFSGFNTELEFWKLFSKRTGMPPLRFREARQ